MMNLHIKTTLLWSILLLLLSACEEKQKFTMDLSDFFNIDKNATYVYKIVDTLKVNGEVKPFMPDRYIEKHLIKEDNNCINIQGYVLFDDKDIEQMDKGLKAKLKDNKLRTIDEKYCVERNTIKINGETVVNLEKKWNIVSEPIPADSSKSREDKTECQVVDVFEKVILTKKRKIIHTQCKSKKELYLSEVDFYFAEKIGLYKMKIFSEDPKSGSQSTNEIILVSRKKGV